MQEETERNFSDVRDGVTVSVSHTAIMDTKWIEDGLAQPGKSKSGLAKALNRAPSMITALLAGNRQLKASEIATIAAYLDRTPPSLIALTNDDPIVAYVSITGDVAAGVWSEPGLDYEQTMTSIPVDLKRPANSMFALRVKGTSINRKAKDGDLILCLDVWAAPRKFQSGDWVVAERERNGLIETTVKRVGTASDGAWLLFPDSDDAQHQTPIMVGETSEETVRVRAFVVDFVRKATVF